MTEEDVPATIPAALRRAAERFGDIEALVDGDRRLTYRQLLDEAERVGRALVASGVGPGDRVAIWAPNIGPWAIASFGIYSVGAVVVTINTRFRGDEAGHVLRTSGAKLLFVVGDFLDTDYVAMLDGVAGLDALAEIVVLSGPVSGGATPFDEFVDRGDAVTVDVVRARSDAVEPDDLSDLVFTSGTTGAPKGAMLAHGPSIRTYLEWSRVVDLRAGDRYFVIFPFFHTGGLKAGLLACVLRGATIYPGAVFDVPSVMELVARERITVLPGPPTVFQSIIDDPNLGTYDLSSVRTSITGATAVPVEVIRQMREVLKIPTVIVGFGLTETTGTVSMCQHDDPPEVIALTVGRPLSGVEVRFVNDDGDDVPAGEPGELLVRGFNVMKGYFDDPEATAAAIDAEGWFKTGDIGLMDGDGNIKITDRKKDMFIVGGFNAYPAEIEKIMVEHSAIAQVAVIGVPDERMGEVGCAFIVVASGKTLPPEDELKAWCRERMANFKVPRRFEVVDALPLNPSGKVMKFKLKESLV